MIEFNQVEGGYDGVPLLNNINLQLLKNQITTIIGPNGSGKSTLLKLATRLLPPLSGTITLAGQDIQKITRSDFAQQVSILPQVRTIPNISVNALVLHGRYPYLTYPRKYSKKDVAIAEEAMKMTGVTDLRHKNILNLSGGERQKAYLAMVIVQNTEIVFLDEPTTYLDIHYQFEIMNLVKELKERGKTVIMVLHDMNLALKYSDRVVIMDQGVLRADGAPEEICKMGIVDEVFHVQSEIVRTKFGKSFIFEPINLRRSYARS